MIKHIVKEGETLEAIARRYEWPSGKALYEAPCNRGLRVIRPNAHSIKKGDEVTIVDTPLQAANRKLALLLKLRADYVELTDGIVKDFKKETQAIKTLTERLDILQAVTDVFAHLGEFVEKGLKSIKLTGAALDKANKELAWSVGRFSYEPAGEAMIDNLVEINPNDEGLNFYAKVIIKCALNYKSITFWAQMLTGTNVLQVEEDVRFTVENHKNKMLADLDKQITTTRELIVALKRNRPY
jgi:hypothetical protein